MALFNEPMEMAAGMWLLSNHENYCAKLTQLVELGEQKSKREARELLDACESLDPTETDELVQEMKPTSYVIAELVIMAKAAQKTQSARNSANQAHKENRSMKAEVLV